MSEVGLKKPKGFALECDVNWDPLTSLEYWPGKGEHRCGAMTSEAIALRTEEER